MGSTSKRGRWLAGGEMSVVGMTLAFAIAIGYFLGAWIGGKIWDSTWGGFLGALIGAAAGFIEIFRTANRYLQREERAHGEGTGAEE